MKAFVVYRASIEFILTNFKLVQVILRPFYMAVVQPLSKIMIPEHQVRNRD